MTAAAKQARRARGEPPAAECKVTDEMLSPAEVLEHVRRVAPIAVDPCTTLENPTGARVIGVSPPAGAMEIARSDTTAILVAVDGLGERFSWAAHAAEHQGLVYVNWPYSTNGPWSSRSRAEWLAGAEVIGLCMSSTSDGWFLENCAPRRSAAVCFWRGRLRHTHLGKRLGPARFSSAVVYWGPRRYRFAEAFADAGAIWM